MAEPQSRSGGQGDPPAAVADTELRASHSDRDQVVELLQVAAGDGRLSSDELDERLERALTAKTYAELAVLTADLPATPGAPVVAAPGAGTVSATPKDLVRIDVHSSGARRDGHWVVPKEMRVTVASGSVTLDFTDAVITQPLLRLAAEVKSGTLTLVTRPGIAVDADDVTVRSGHVRVPPAPGPGVPVVLRVEISGSVRSGTITAGPPRAPRPARRTFWQWLTRAPRRRAITA